MPNYLTMRAATPNLIAILSLVLKLGKSKVEEGFPVGLDEERSLGERSSFGANPDEKAIHITWKIRWERQLYLPLCRIKW